MALHPARLHAPRGRFLLAGVTGLMLVAGCASSSGPETGLFGGLFGPQDQAQAPGPGPSPTPVVAKQEPERAGCGTTAQCKGTLKTMIESPDRGWIGKRQSPVAYADGTRLFAYRALRKQLTCNELTLAVDELRGASRSLGGAVAGMTPDQLSRTRALCSQVESELTQERSGRCRT